MTGSYTPLNIASPKKKTGPSMNEVLISIAVVIMLALGGIIWFMIEQQKQQEIEIEEVIPESQTIRNVQVEVSPTPIASPTAGLNTPTPSILPTSGQVTITPQATQSGALQQ